MGPLSGLSFMAYLVNPAYRTAAAAALQCKPVSVA